MIYGYECDVHVNLLADEDRETAICECCGNSKAAAIKAGEAFPRLFDIQVGDKHLTLCHKCVSKIWRLTSQAISVDIRYAVIREGYTPNYVTKVCSVVRESADDIVLDEIVDSARVCTTRYSFTSDSARELVFKERAAAEKKAKSLIEQGL